MKNNNITIKFKDQFTKKLAESGNFFGSVVFGDLKPSFQNTILPMILSIAQAEEKKNAQIGQWSVIAGYPIKCLNQWQLYCLGATRDVVEENKISANLYHILINNCQTKLDKATYQALKILTELEKNSQL